MMEACEIYDVPEEAVLPEDSGFPAGAVPEAPEKRCYTVEDLQNILMCSRTTVYDLLKTNQFRYFKLGRTGYRISRKSFDEWLDKQ